MQVVIIGGGPAGMMAGITAKKNHPNDEVIILEKNGSTSLSLLYLENLFILNSAKTNVISEKLYL